MFGLSTAGALATFYVVASILASLFVVAACVASSRAKRKGDQLFLAAHLAEQEAKIAALDARVTAPAASHRRPATIVATHRNTVYDENRTEQANEDELAHRDEIIKSVLDVLAELDSSPEQTKVPLR